MALLFSFQLTALKGATSTFSENYQINLSYWNDNFGYQKLLKDIIPVGDDDFMTASGRFEVGSGDEQEWRSWELYFAIFTNHMENNRFDMMAGRYAREFQQGPWHTKLGTGLLVRGSLGGAFIQNSFHSARGYSVVDLPYVEGSRLGVLFYGRVARDIFSFKSGAIQVYGTSALRFGAGPTNLRFGFEGERHQKAKKLPLRTSWLLRIGYAHYLLPSEVIAAHFKHGFVTGIQTGFVFRGSFGLTLWFTENQYGLNDPQYGITLSYRPESLVLPKLHSVIFP